MHSRYYGLYRAETSIMHGSEEKMETTSLCRYNYQILADGSSIKIYNISTSAFRNTIRQNATFRLLKILDITLDDLPEISQIIFMSGGPRLEKGDYDPLAYKREIKKWFPILDLLGSTTPFCMIEGRMYPTSLNAITKSIANNNFEIEDSLIDEFKLDKNKLPNIITEFQFNTKRDPRTKEVEEAKDTDYGTVANMFDTQMIIKGTQLGHQVVIRDHETNLLASCFNSALQEWKRNGCYIGGKKSQGCGKVSFNYSPELITHDLYESFVAKNREVIKKLILDKKVWEDKKYIFELLKNDTSA